MTQPTNEQYAERYKRRIGRKLHEIEQLAYNIRDLLDRFGVDDPESIDKDMEELNQLAASAGLDVHYWRAARGQFRD